VLYLYKTKTGVFQKRKCLFCHFGESLAHGATGGYHIVVRGS
jgi:hypothetical protein